MLLFCAAAGRSFHEKKIDMATWPEKLKCSKCYHDCHCDTLVCSDLIGVGLSDKSQPCGCGVCECSTPKQSR